MTQLSAILVFLTMAAPGAAAGEEGNARNVGLQAIDARPGSDRTTGIDPALAEKIRATLKAMGMAKPDLTGREKKVQALSAGQTMSVKAALYELEITCREVSAESVSIAATLYREETDPKTGEKVRKVKNRTSATLKPDGDPHVVVAVRKDSDKKRLFVASCEK